MARKKELNNGATCANNNNGNCKVHEGLDCPFEKKSSCPDSGAKRVYIPYPFDGTLSVLYKYDKNGNISHLGFYIDELVELSNKQ